MSERANKRSGYASEASGAKRAVRSKRVIERCERTSELILRGSESQSILPIVRPKQVSGASMTTDSKSHAHAHTHTHARVLTHIYTHERETDRQRETKRERERDGGRERIDEKEC